MQNPRSELDDAQLCSAVESILLVAGGPVAFRQLATALGIPRSRTVHLLDRLRAEARGGIRLQIHDDSVQLVTAPENVDIVHRFLGTSRPAPLTRSALETLTIVAYQQPVTRPEIESLRGVNSDRAVQTLVARGLIEEQGKRDTIGRPVEYGTTYGFLEYFGLSSLHDLPALPDAAELHVAPIDIGLRDRGTT